MANTITYETLFEKKLQERLARPQNWKEMCNVEMTDTSVISSSYISTSGGWAADAALTRGTSVAPTDVAEIADTLTISTGRHVTTYFDYADLAQSPWTTEAETFSRAGERLGEYIETAVLLQHGSWRNIGNSGGAWTDNTDVVLAASASNIDDLARILRQVVRAQNGATLMERNKIGAVISPVSFNFVEAFAQANGFQSADAALEKGLAPQVYYLGVYWYISNDNVTDHAMGGVRKVQRLGILRGTFGRMHTFPGGSGAANQIQSGIVYHSRVDIGHLTPTSQAALVFDIRDDNS